ncbi:MAG TPA: AMP-binding protein [Burkholderiaceae bacterium]|nr:AMP-binding protein [Burkholderiaceae bacterium]HQR72310.1 AMP-binding protein [Burkholderiaceae bacterium]
MTQNRLMLDYVLDHEEKMRDRVCMTQPVGNNQVVDYTWGQVVDQSRRIAAHLQSHGFPRGARVAILSKNCAHFIMAEIAIWMAGYTTVAIFPTETAETINYVLTHSEASLLFVGKLDTWPHQKPGVPQGLPCVAFPLAPQTGFETWDAIVARTPPLAGRPSRNADELAMLIYTSGSTGTPKGVMITFEAFTRAGEGIASEVIRRVGTTENRMLSYLPLAHSFERSWAEGASLVDGRIHLYFAESLDTFLQDLQRTQPTLFLSVPRLWLKFQQGVFAKMPPAKLDRLLGIPILGKIVAKKVRKGLGLDHVKLAGSGSAPIPPDLISWYRKIGLPLYEGYGMTEDSSYSHVSDEQNNAPGYVGVPMPGVQVKLSPEGEVLIKSPGQCTGYYKQPELTAASFTEDGYFRTGDLGERTAAGLLKLTGRAKELFKTAKGKYVAPAPIENRLNAHPMVELSLVSGVGQPAAYAMVILAEHLRPRMGEPALRAEVERELTQLLQQVNSAVSDHEQLHMIVVAQEPWSIENGFLTPTMKIRRARIENAMEPHVGRWYGTGRRVHWH